MREITKDKVFAIREYEADRIREELVRLFVGRNTQSNVSYSTMEVSRKYPNVYELFSLLGNR